MTSRLTHALAATSLLCLSATASAVDFQPRLGVQVGNYYVEGAGTSEKMTGGPILGLSMGGEYGFADVGFEALPVDVIGPGSRLTSGWRSEVTGTLGFFVTEGVALIGGYRSSGYGESFASSKFGTNAGPFVGVSFPDLRIGSSNRNLLTLSIAIQQTTYTDKSNNLKLDSDTGVNIRVGFRRAGSPHSIGVRYQSFGSPTYQEYLTSLQYSYVFGSF